jgi:hypothetical protein
MHISCRNTTDRMMNEVPGIFYMNGKCAFLMHLIIRWSSYFHHHHSLPMVGNVALIHYHRNLPVREYLCPNPLKCWQHLANRDIF